MLSFTAAAVVTMEYTYRSSATNIPCRSALAREGVGRGDRDAADLPQTSVRAIEMRQIHHCSRAIALLQLACVSSTLIAIA
jgi:hypothetical protein